MAKGVFICLFYQKLLAVIFFGATCDFEDVLLIMHPFGFALVPKCAFSAVGEDKGNITHFVFYRDGLLMLVNILHMGAEQQDNFIWLTFRQKIIGDLQGKLPCIFQRAGLIDAAAFDPRCFATVDAVSQADAQNDQQNDAGEPDNRTLQKLFSIGRSGNIGRFQ